MFRSKHPRKTPEASSVGEMTARLGALREELRKIERSGWSGKTGEAVALGLPEIDRLLSGENLFDGKALSDEAGVFENGGTGALTAEEESAFLSEPAAPPKLTTPRKPGAAGLRSGCLHEFSGEGAEAFAAILSGRLKGPVLWCADAMAGSALYPPGLKAFGLDHRRLILVRCRKPREILAAMEDGLRCRALAAVIGELSGGIDLTASRRLQLAAENSGVTGFLVKSAWRDPVLKSRPAGKKGSGKAGDKTGGGKIPETGSSLLRAEEKEPSAAFSRWSVNSARSSVQNSAENNDYTAEATTWRLSLLRCRNGGRGAWTVKWDAKAYRFSLAAEIADGQVDPPTEHSSGQRLVG